MQNPTQSPRSPSRARLWQKRVADAFDQAVEELEEVFRDERDRAEVAFAVQGVLFRVVGRSFAAARGLWPDDGTLSALREKLDASENVVPALAALDADVRSRAPWSGPRPWLVEQAECPIDRWPPEVAATLADAALSWDTGRGSGVEAGLPVQEIGRLYETLLVLHDRYGQSAAQPFFGKRKSTGCYYTPDHIVAHITRSALAPITDELAPESILSLRVLDPAMGTGHFLLEALRFLSESLAKPERGAARSAVRRRWLAADTCLYGVDRDARAVEVTKLLLWLAIGSRRGLPPGLARHLRVGNSLVGCEVEDLSSLPGGERMVALGCRVRAEMLRQHADEPVPRQHAPVRASCDLRTSLWFEPPPETTDVKYLFDRARRLAQEHHFFHWNLAFPEVFCDEEGRKREDGGFDAIIGNPPYAAHIKPFRAVVRKGRYTTTAKASRRPASLNTAALFIDRSHQLLRPNGILGLIVPNSILRVGQYAQVRQLLLDRYTLLTIADEGAPFDGANLEMVSIIARQRAAQPDHRVLIRDRRSARTGAENRIEQRHFQERGVIAIYLDDVALTVEKAPERLRAVVRNQRGVGVSPNDLLYLSRNPAAGRWMLRGRNLSRYALIHLPGEDRYLRRPLTGPHASFAALFAGRKLLIQNIGSQIVATLSTRGEGFLETVNILRPLDGSGFSLPALLVILNSRLMNYYFRRALINRSPLTVHLDGSYTDTFPLPDCTKALGNPELARRAARRLGKPALAEKPAARLLDALGAQLTDCGNAWSEALANATRALLADIGWGTESDALDLVKRNLWAAPTDAFIEELRRRDPAIGRKPRAVEAAAAVHQRAHEELAAAGTALGRSPFPYDGSLDALADEVVYCLYGLSPDQIGRVEAESAARPA